MKFLKQFLLPVSLGVAVSGLCANAFAEETVTIPKSRLEELERQAAELEKLKKELNRSREENKRLEQAKEKAEAEKQQLQKARDAAEARAAQLNSQAGLPAPYVPPPLASLPPLAPGEIISAMDLAGHYAADATGAAARYGKKWIAVEGEIAGFSKPMFIRPYKILLKTADPARKVFCTFTPPDDYKAVYPARNGMTLVGLTRREAEVTLFKVGQTVVVEGKCTGADDTGVHLSGCSLRSVK